MPVIKLNINVYTHTRNEGRLIENRFVVAFYFSWAKTGIEGVLISRRVASHFPIFDSLPAYIRFYIFFFDLIA